MSSKVIIDINQHRSNKEAKERKKKKEKHYPKFNDWGMYKFQEIIYIKILYIIHGLLFREIKEEKDR